MKYCVRKWQLTKEILTSFINKNIETYLFDVTLYQNVIIISNYIKL